MRISIEYGVSTRSINDILSDINIMIRNSYDDVCKSKIHTYFYFNI